MGARMKSLVRQPPAPTATDPGRLSVFARLAIELALTPVIFLLYRMASPDLAYLALTIATLAVCLLEFFLHGGVVISAFGIYSLSSAIFGGFAGFLNMAQAESIDQYDLAALGIVYASTVVIMATGSLYEMNHPRFPPRPASDRTPFYFIAPLFLIIGLLLDGRSFNSGAADIPVYGGAVIGLILVFERPFRSHPGRTLALWFIGFGSVALYALHFFNGFGRLNVASLGLCAPFLWSRNHNSPTYRPKAIIVLLLPVFILAASYIGATRNYLSPTLPTGSGLLNYVGSGEALQMSGLASVGSPLATFGDLLRSERFGIGKNLGYGRTFFVALVSWVPRAIWPDKPPGFGRELAGELYPALPEFVSIAALAHGEWYYNFGGLGLLLMVPATAFFLLLLDKGMARLMDDLSNSRALLLKRAALTVLILGVADYLWVGSFTYAARAGFRAGFIALLLLVGRALGWTKAQKD